MRRVWDPKTRRYHYKANHTTNAKDPRPIVISVPFELTGQCMQAAAKLPGVVLFLNINDFKYIDKENETKYPEWPDNYVKAIKANYYKEAPALAKDLCYILVNDSDIFMDKMMLMVHYIKYEEISKAVYPSDDESVYCIMKNEKYTLFDLCNAPKVVDAINEKILKKQMKIIHDPGFVRLDNDDQVIDLDALIEATDDDPEVTE